MPVKIEMNMPENCRVCPICDLYNFECRLHRYSDIWTIGHKSRPCFCPLKEVKQLWEYLMYLLTQPKTQQIR